MPLVASSVSAELEARTGVEPLDQLLAERARLVGEVSELRARYGPGGTYNDLRRIELARLAALIRAQALKDQIRLTESAVDDMTHAHPLYIKFVTNATTDRAEWSVLEDRIAAVQDRIFRGQALLRFAASELHLNPGGP
jgi:hypothetical protein